MDWGHLLALSTFAAYFIVIIALFSLIISSLLPIRLHHQRFHIYAFSILATVSFAHTWFYMFKFLYWSFISYEKGLKSTPATSFVARISEWLLNTKLFEQAWYTVSSNPISWWWSEQICLYTVGPWSVFLVVQGSINNVKHTWAYMLLGQLLAVSVASNLFFLALILPHPTPAATPKFKTQKKIPSFLFPPSLVIVPLAAYHFIVKIPSAAGSMSSSFLFYLLAFHALIFQTFVFSPPFRPKTTFLLSRVVNTISLKPRTAYALLTPVAVAIRMYTVRRTIATGVTLPNPNEVSLWTILVDLFSYNWASNLFTFELGIDSFLALFSHPALASIGWDVIWTSVSIFVWAAIQESRGRGGTKAAIAGVTLICCVCMLQFGVGVVGLVLFAFFGDTEDEELVEG